VSQYSENERAFAALLVLAMEYPRRAIFPGSHFEEADAAVPYLERASVSELRKFGEGFDVGVV